jgi:hypothetical protein
MAQAMGIPVPWVHTAVFAIGAGRRGLYITWPALSVILVIEVALGRHEEASPHALWH